MSKIYAVMSSEGVGEDVCVTIEKCFRNIKKAQKYVEELIDDDNQSNFMFHKCSKCGGNDKSCPFWAEPTILSDGCENYDTYTSYEPTKSFYIEDSELEE